MNMRDTSKTVVVLKLEHYGALGIVRSLGRLGIHVYGVDASGYVPAFKSKYCAGSFVWDIDKAPIRKTIDYLLQVGRSIGGRPILIPTSDEMTLMVAEHRDALSEEFTFPSVPFDLVNSLCNKKEMFFLAKKHRIPTAETLFPVNRHEVLSSIDNISFPVMLKGIDGGRLEQKTGKKMDIIYNAKELLEKYEFMEDPEQPNLMIQEYIPGGEESVWMFNGYFNRRSECLVGFTGEKIRQNPVYTGMTSLGICRWNPEVAKTTEKFMKAIGYQGILDIGYRYDARDGRYKVLDVNPRIGATFRLFVGMNGMDVVRTLYLDLTGQRVPPTLPCEGRKWIVEDKDLHSTLNYMRDGNLGLLQWIVSLRGIDEAGYFALDDLAPFAAVWTGHVRKKVLSWLSDEEGGGQGGRGVSVDLAETAINNPERMLLRREITEKTS